MSVIRNAVDCNLNANRVESIKGIVVERGSNVGVGGIARGRDKRDVIYIKDREIYRG